MKKLEFYKIIAEKTSNPIYICDNHDRINFVNKSASEIWINTENDICYKRFYHQNKPCSWCPRSDRNGNGISLIPPLNRSFRIESIRLDNENNAFILNEITEINNLMKRFEEMKSILEASSDLVLLFDMSGEIDYVNRTANEILAKGKNLIGKNILEFFEQHQHVNLSRIIRKLFETSEIQFETSFITKDKQIIPVEINTNIIDYREQKCILFFAREIKERKKNEEQLRNSEVLFKNFFYSSPIAMIAFDEFGNIIRFNKAAEDLYGFKAEEILNKPLLESIYKHSDSALSLISEVFSGNQVRDKEINCLDRLGRTKSILVNEFPIKDKEGGFILGLSAQIDITERKELEQEMLLLKQAIQASRDGVIISDLNGRIIFTNPSQESIYGYNRNELIGKHIQIFTPSSENEDALNQVITNLQNKGSISAELKAQRKNGTIFPILFNASVITDNYGVPKGIIGLTYDITSEKEATAKIEALSNLNQEIIDNLDTAIHLVDKDGSILLTNHRLNELAYPLLSSELVSSKNTINSLTPEAFTEVEQVIKNMEPSIKEFLVDRKEGNLYLEIKRFPLLDKNGKVDRILSVIRDITAAKKGLRLRQMLKVVLDNASESLLLLDTNNKVIYANASFLSKCGFSEQPLSIQLESLLASWESNRFKSILEQTNKSGIWTGDIYITSRSGETFPTLTSFIRLGSEKSKEGMGVLSIDITETKKLQHKLQKRLASEREQINQDRSYLLSISHGLHTNMNTLSGFTTLLDDQTQINTKQKEYISYIKHSSKRLMTLINNLVGFVEIESHAFSSKKQTFRILSFFIEKLSSFKDILDNSGILFLYDRNDDPEFYGSTEIISLIFENLIETVIDLAKEQKIRIEITTIGKTDENSNYHIAMKFIPEKPVFKHLMDNIISEDERIFPALSNENQTWTSLFLIQSILQNIGGKLNFKEINDNIVLILLLSSDDKYEILGGSKLKNRDEKKLIVLIVEDIPEHQEEIIEAYKEKCTFINAETGGKALQIIEEIKPDLVLIDIYLPDMNGFAVAEKIREYEWGKQIPIIGMSAYSFSKNEVSLIETNFDQFIEKPITKDLWRKIIEKYNP
ncbi:MAG: PAS domain S-box protein [Candidatus Coatesbacteria bacterium]|nr:PAS domain S-box protein [Candidatus Coatesbacteria bacterium]